MSIEHAMEKRPSDSKNRAIGWRSAIMIDIDRILYSPEFRRLEGVTQVRSPQDDYVYHDRLTHSMKVAQVAERLAQKLLYDFKGDHKLIKLCPEVCYAAGLAHDLGHPPFGHVAEDELQKVLDENDALDDSFEGNAQSFRIVTKTSFRKTDPSISQEKFSFADGLDLTWRTLAAISKYPWLKDKQPKPNNARSGDKLGKKWGFYESEKEYYEYMKENRYFHQYEDSTLPKQSLEAQVMDWADDITYAVHDLEDYFRGQMVPLERLSLSLEHISSSKPPKGIAIDQLLTQKKYVGSLFQNEWTSLYSFIKESIQKNLLDPETRKPLSLTDEDIFSAIIKVRLELPKAPFDGGRQSHSELRHFGSAMITRMQDNTRIEESPVANKKQPEYYLYIEPNAQLVAIILKSIFKYYVVNSPQLKIMQTGQRTVIRELYEKLTDLCAELADDVDLASLRPKDASNDDSFMDRVSEKFPQLPARLREYFTQSLVAAFELGNEKYFDKKSSININEEDLACERKKITSRPVIDFICTLTDKQATLLHKRLTGDDIGTLSSYWLNI